MTGRGSGGQIREIGYGWTRRIDRTLRGSKRLGRSLSSYYKSQ